MNPAQQLALLLRPAAGGIHLVSTGRAQQLALQRKLYGVSTDAEVERAFQDRLSRIAGAKVVLLGVPSDVGAGFMRGANFGPQAIRQALINGDPGWPSGAAAQGVLDVGDVLAVPQLLHDDMLSESQKDACRRALYPGVEAGEVGHLPVSPLSMTERALDIILSLNPRCKPFVLGGDHSVAWPVVSALAKTRREPWAIVQIDAHTDLLPERLGIRYCFATWSYHANELLGRGGRLIQVGVRASRHDRGHWESTLGVRQFWARECLDAPERVIGEIIDHLRRIGAATVYFSNDIDGTDAAQAEATGTAEPNGLLPEFVTELVGRLGTEIGLCAGDLMEVAPSAARTPEGTARTLRTATEYVKATLAALTR